MAIIDTVSEPNKGRILKIYIWLSYRHSPQISVLINAPVSGFFHTMMAPLSLANFYPTLS